MPDYKVRYKVVKEYDVTADNPDAAQTAYENDPAAYAGSEVLIRQKVACVIWTENGEKQSKKY